MWMTVEDKERGGYVTLDMAKIVAVQVGIPWPVGVEKEKQVERSWLVLAGLMVEVTKERALEIAHTIESC